MLKQFTYLSLLLLLQPLIISAQAIFRFEYWAFPNMGGHSTVFEAQGRYNLPTDLRARSYRWTTQDPNYFLILCRGHDQVNAFGGTQTQIDQDVDESERFDNIVIELGGRPRC